MKTITIRGIKYPVKRSTRKGKDYMIVLKNGKTVHFGSDAFTLGVNNKKRRRSYCARSGGIKTRSSYSPNALSRKMWKC